MSNKIRSVLLGKPLKDSDLTSEKMPVIWGIPVFASDAISSVSYAGEEILLVLIPALGALAYKSFLPVVLAIIALLAILVFCYRQTIDAYPQGGGSYIVAGDNLGEKSGLIAGSSLIIGYVLTVAVSSCAGAAAITSAFPSLHPYKALIAFALIAILTWGNLRGMRESAVIFGIPTYLFIFTMLAMIITGVIKYTTGAYTPAEMTIVVSESKDMLLFVVLKAFASGCTALTGVEAVSNGVPNFKEPSPKNAKKVLYAMAIFVCIVFFGVSLLVKWFQIVPADSETAVSQLAGAVFGGGSIMYYVVQIMTVIILALAANTAFAGLPLLMALMARDGYLPRRLVSRGSRLNYSVGIIVLFALSSVLVFAFNGSQHHLLPLYASGVLLSFFLNQLGMLVHWIRNKGSGWKFKAVINGFGTVVTFITFIIIVVMKFTSGAWVTIICIGLFMFIMLKIKQHYDKVSGDLALTEAEAVELLQKIKPSAAILPVQSINRSFMKTFKWALGCGFESIELYNVSSSEESALALKAEIEKLGLPVTFNYEVTEYRNINEVLINYVQKQAEELLPQNKNLTVMMGSIEVTNIFQSILHNHTTDHLVKKLSKNRNVSIFTVPYVV